MQMSSSSVCQGLQSCLEPCLIEPRVLRLKLAPPGSNVSPTSGCPGTRSLSDSDSNTKQTITNTTTSTPARTNYEHDTRMYKDADMGGWTFLQSLAADTSRCDKTEDPVTEKVYVHPTVKRSSSMLSAKSLEMCTESLGSETGSNASENCDDVALFSSKTSSTFFTRHVSRAGRSSVSRRLNRDGSFPPPLTSISDSGGLQVRPHREDGRLILKAVVTPSPRPYFEAERSNGRLRLRLFQTITSDSYDDEVVADDEEIGEEESNDEKEAEIDAENFNQEVCGEEDNDNAEGEMGMRKISRPFRCNESRNRNQEMLKWEPFWVAT